MHCTQKPLLDARKLDCLFVAAFAFHLCRDTSDDYYRVGIGHFRSKRFEFDESSFAELSAEHCEIAVSSSVFDLHVISLTFDNRE